MGRLCKAARRWIDDAAEAGEAAARRAKRAARRAVREAQDKVDDTQKALDALPPRGAGTRIQEETRKALEELKRQYDSDLKKAKDHLNELEGLSSAYEQGTRTIDGTFAMLDANDAQFRELSFEAASNRILALVEAHLGPAGEGRLDPCPPCPPFASPVDLGMAEGVEPVIDLDARAQLLSDDGLDAFARSLGATPPAELPCEQRLAGYVFYGAVAPGLSRFELASDLARGSAFAAPLVRELFADAIAQTYALPETTLARERAHQLAEPRRLAEFAEFQVLPGLCFQVRGEIANRGGQGQQARHDSEARRTLIHQKSFILGRRARARNLKLAQGLLAIFGLDFLLEEGDQEALDKILNFFIIGEWVLGAIELLALILRLLARPKLWERLVKRYGRFGALRFLAGLGGRLVPALMAAAIAYAWYDIYQEWVKDSVDFDRDLKRLYVGVSLTEVPDRDEIFKDNLGYIPG